MAGFASTWSRRGWVTLLVSAVHLAAVAAPPEAMNDLGRLAREARELESRLRVPELIEPSAGFELPLVAREHLRRTLPGLWRKLSQRLPVRLLVLSDADALALRSASPLEAGQELSFVQRWARALARRFYYTGGVQDFAAAPLALSPAIHLRVVAEAGQSLVDAASVLQSLGRQAPPDLVIIAHSHRASPDQDAESQGLDLAVEGVKELGAELLLVAGPCGCSERLEEDLGRSALGGALLAKAAQRHGLAFVNLADVALMLGSAASYSKDAAQAFEAFSTRWRALFLMDDQERFWPTEPWHELAAKALMDGFMGAAKGPLAVQEGGAVIRRVEQTRAALQAKLRWTSTGQGEQALLCLPLRVEGLKPMAAALQWQRVESGLLPCSMDYGWPADGQGVSAREEWLLPLLVLSADRVTSVVVEALPQPIALIAQRRWVYNQEGEWRATVAVINHGESELAGRWQAQIRGLAVGRMGGSLRLPPGGSAPLDLSFRLGEAESSELGAAIRQGELEVSVTFGEDAHTQRWPLWVAPNLGLGKPFALIASRSTAPLSCMARADAEEMVFECSLPSTELPVAEALPDAVAWRWRLGLDARSYGSRLEPGSLLPLEFSGGAEPGRGKLAAIRPWAFGTGYAALFDASLASVEYREGDGRFGSLVARLPRSWFYLHEWALGNGNSQLGLRMELEIQTSSGLRHWSLFPFAQDPRSTSGLGVLELTQEPTRRFGGGMR